MLALLRSLQGGKRTTLLQLRDRYTPATVQRATNGGYLEHTGHLLYNVPMVSLSAKGREALSPSAVEE